MRSAVTIMTVAMFVLAGCSGSGASDVPEPTRSSAASSDAVQPPVGRASEGGDAGACPVANPDCGDNPGAVDPGTDPDIAPLAATPMTDLLDVRPTPWEFVNFNQDQTVATVAWFGGNPACDGLDRVEVDLEAATVTFTVFTGRVPGDRACTLELVLKAVEIDMGETLGPRSVRDGAT